MWGNVPDDWDCYWRNCPDCGARYHMSDGGCDCYIQRREEKWDEIIDRLGKGSIAFVEFETSKWSTGDELGDDVGAMQPRVRIYLDEKVNDEILCDELIFTTNNWDEIRKVIKYDELGRDES